MKTLKYLAILIFFIILVGCSDENNNSLTAITQNGEGTISCKLGGEIWLPKSGEGLWGLKRISHYLHSFVIEFDSSYTYNKVNELMYVEFNLGNGDKFLTVKMDSVLDIGKYYIKNAKFNNDAKFYGAYEIYDSDMDSNFVNITYIKRDYIQASYDEFRKQWNWGYYSENTIISGTFNFILRNKAGEIVRITNGRFDMKNWNYI